MENRHKPLGLKEKWLCLVHWVVQDQSLTFTEVKVLTALLQRQNPADGQCNPAVVRLTLDTGACERGVRDALSKLERRGAIRRFRTRGQLSNDYQISSVEELQRNRFHRNSQPEERESYLQSSAQSPAAGCQIPLQPAAPKKIKEKIKKKETGLDTERVSQDAFCDAKRHAEISYSEFERRIAKVFERKGFGYVALIGLPDGVVEEAYQTFSRDEKSFSATVGDLLAMAAKESE